MRFADGDLVLGEVVASSSDDGRIRPSVNVEGSTVYLTFDFLNAGDTIELEVLSTASATDEPQRCGTVEGLRRGVEDVTTTSSWITRRVSQSLDSEQMVASVASSASLFGAIISGLIALFGSGFLR